MSFICVLFLCAADPDSEINVTEANKTFMAQSEELYSALIGCFFQPPESWDGVTCSASSYLPEPIDQYEEMDSCSFNWVTTWLKQIKKFSWLYFCNEFSSCNMIWHVAAVVELIQLIQVYLYLMFPLFLLMCKQISLVSKWPT